MVTEEAGTARKEEAMEVGWIEWHGKGKRPPVFKAYSACVVRTGSEVCRFLSCAREGMYARFYERRP